MAWFWLMSAFLWSDFDLWLHFYDYVAFKQGAEKEMEAKQKIYNT